MRTFTHTVAPDDTAVAVGSGDLEVLATPRLVTWCEKAAFLVCRKSVDEDHTTVGTMVRIEHVKGTPVGAEITVRCAEPINDGRRLVCHVSVKDAAGEEIGRGEVHRAVVDRERFMAKCQPLT
jgi:fluoroacetyl-CoA thioesterase